MKLGSLFDGAGTCPLAGSMCGVKPAWASEIEPFPVAVSSSNFPGMVHLGDITKVHGDQIEPVDILTFGSPCQDLSIAGKRAGLDGERSGLFMEAVRIIKEMRCATHGKYPQIVVWENVPGAFSSHKGEDFRIVLEELCRIQEPDADLSGPPKKLKKSSWPCVGEIVGDGYSIAWRTLDARGWGVPQRRRRIFLVLDLGGGCAGEILFKRPGLSRDFKAERRTRETPGSAAEGCAGKTSRGIPYTLKIRGGCAGGGKGVLVQEDLSATLATHNDQVLFCPSYGFKAGQSAKAGGLGFEKEVSPALGADMSGTEPTVLCRAIDSHPQDKRVGFSKDGTVQTLPARMGTGGGNVPFVLQAVPAASLRRIRDGRHSKYGPEPRSKRGDGSGAGSEKEGV